MPKLTSSFSVLCPEPENIHELLAFLLIKWLKQVIDYQNTFPLIDLSFQLYTIHIVYVNNMFKNEWEKDFIT